MRTFTEEEVEEMMDKSTEHDGCKGCKYEKCSMESKECMGCKQNSVDKYKRMTQADRIRYMSDEELAEFLVNFAWDNEPKKKETYEWLQSEVEE